MKPGTEVQAVALDFDGVVADSMPWQEQAWVRALDEVIPSAGEGLRSKIRRNLYAGKAGSQMFEGIELPPEKLRSLRHSKDDLWRDLQPRVALMEGAGAGLRKLSACLPLTIATTSDRRYVQALLERENVADCFAMVLTGRDVENPKPAPDSLFKIADALEIPLDSLLLVGDTVTDLKMARAAGSPFILFGGSAVGEDLPSSIERAYSWKELTERIPDRLPVLR